MPSTRPPALLVLQVLCLLRRQAVALSAQQVSMPPTRPPALLVLQVLCLIQGQAVALSA